MPLLGAGRTNPRHAPLHRTVFGVHERHVRERNADLVRQPLKPIDEVDTT